MHLPCSDILKLEFRITYNVDLDKTAAFKRTRNVVLFNHIKYDQSLFVSSDL